MRGSAWGMEYTRDGAREYRREGVQQGMHGEYTRDGVQEGGCEGVLVRGREYQTQALHLTVPITRRPDGCITHSLFSYSRYSSNYELTPTV